MSTMNYPLPAKYTERLGNIVDYYGINIFNFPYDIYVPTGSTESEQKKQLQQAFIDYYYMREIGQETIELFKHYLRTSWTQVIKAYNPLFEAAGMLSANDAFINDKFHNKNDARINNAPKGIVDFDDNHVSAFTITKDDNEGLRGQTRFDALKRMSSQLVAPVLDFLAEFEDLFLNLLY